LDNSKQTEIISASDLQIKIFADGARIEDIIEMNRNPIIQGLTTNPTLMRKAGVKNYKDFALEVLTHVKIKPISLEVFSDDLKEMEKQAEEIASWGENVYVKIPITNSKGISTLDIISKLIEKEIKINTTAIMTLDQVKRLKQILNPNVKNYVSIFAGRIADTGRDPVPIMEEALNILKTIKTSEVIWASPRELLNIIQADKIGCHIITASTDILEKIKLLGYDLEKYSLETVAMFYRDALESEYQIQN
jgi:transaldolase